MIMKHIYHSLLFHVFYILGTVSLIGFFCNSHISFLYLKPLSEFQRIAGRDKKALSEQCKEIEENNRKGKTGDLFKKIGVTKGTFSCKDEHNKGQKWQGPNRRRD